MLTVERAREIATKVAGKPPLLMDFADMGETMHEAWFDDFGRDVLSIFYNKRTKEIWVLGGKERDVVAKFKA